MFQNVMTSMSGTPYLPANYLLKTQTINLAVQLQEKYQLELSHNHCFSIARDLFSPL